MKKNWWKILAVILLAYTVIMGFLGDVPAMFILRETIRNLYFHVTMWFAMQTLIVVALVYGVKYLIVQGKVDKGQDVDGSLKRKAVKFDIMSKESINVALVFGAVGLLTGSIWAKSTWGTYWAVEDPKLNGAALGFLMYLIYNVLRNSVKDEDKRARVAAVFNMFAFMMFVVFVNVIPRMKDSLHPGNGGNPGFSAYDLDSDLRLVFYPAVLGWILFSIWILQIRIRMQKIIRIKEYNEHLD